MQSHRIISRCPKAALAAVFCLVMFGFTKTADAEEPTLPDNHLSLGLGFPLAVGGLVKLELLHRFDPKNFVKVGVGSAVILNSIYISYGRRFSDDPESSWYAYGGLENTLVLVMGGDEVVPGAHAGIGRESISSGGWRTAYGLAIGFPYLLGLTFEVGR